MRKGIKRVHGRFSSVAICWNVLELVGVTEGEGSGNRGKVPELIGVTEGSGINMHY